MEELEIQCELSLISRDVLAYLKFKDKLLRGSEKAVEVWKKDTKRQFYYPNFGVE